MPCRIAFGPDRTEAIRNHQRRAEAYAALPAKQTAPALKPSIKAAVTVADRALSSRIMPVAAHKKRVRPLTDDRQTVRYLPSSTSDKHAQTGGV